MKDGIVNVDFGAGERMWKIWSSQEIQGLQIRILSKRFADGTFQLSVVLDGSCGKQYSSKILPGVKEFEQEAALARKAGAEFGFEFICRDFSDVTTAEELARRCDELGWNIKREQTDV